MTVLHLYSRLVRVLPFRRAVRQVQELHQPPELRGDQEDQRGQGDPEITTVIMIINTTVLANPLYDNIVTVVGSIH